jgi:hypothetical protein
MRTSAEWPLVLRLGSFMGRTELFARILEYANRNGLVVGKQLGFGVHGIVFDAESQSKTGLSAIKAHEREAEYARERDIYLRLRENAVTEIRGCNVPTLLRFDDQALILEMTVVCRPFVLDFAGAYLDRPFDFSEEVMADWWEAKREQFGAHWPEAQSILRALECYGIFMEDVHPNNIAFVD